MHWVRKPRNPPDLKDASDNPFVAIGEIELEYQTKGDNEIHGPHIFYVFEKNLIADMIFGKDVVAAESLLVPPGGMLPLVRHEEKKLGEAPLVTPQYRGAQIRM